MNMRLSIATTGILALGTACTTTVEKPNIVWILAEDMSLDLSCYGMQGVHTPNLDRLASEGIVYTNARCATPISSPSRSAMLTGMHSTRIDAHNHRSNREKPLPEGVRPFTYYLREAGYTCVLGKEGIFRPSFSNKNSQSAYKIDGNFKWTETGAWDGKENFGIFDCMDTLPEKGPFFNQITLFVTHRGDWWKQIRKQSKHPVDPATIALPPFMAEHPKVREEFACYLDQVEYMDSEVGRIMADLEASGMAKNTIVFFIGDNGRADIRGKGFLYDAGTQVPMIVWGKGISHKVVDHVVSTVDITATILQLAGVEIPENMESRPLLDKSLQPVCPRDYVYSTRDNWDEVAECMRGITTDRYLYIRNFFPQYPYDRPQVYLDFHRPALHIMRQLKAEGKLNEYEGLFMAETKPEEELYDIIADPDNLHNLATNHDYANVMEEMRGLFIERTAQYEDMGIADRFDRDKNSRLAEDNVRDYMLTNHPDIYAEKVLSGDIVTEYHVWSKWRRDWWRAKRAAKK